MRSDDDRRYAEFGLDPPDQKRGRRIDDGDRNPRVCWGVSVDREPNIRRARNKE
ncbi:MAG: hypothetical protein C5S49_00205 [Candidatus Methanogaster sp.]|nr:MAG: hypothetical protein C5S49_00205 [ANME-2 cluster archaeon]